MCISWGTIAKSRRQYEAAGQSKVASEHVKQSQQELQSGESDRQGISATGSAMQKAQEQSTRGARSWLAGLLATLRAGSTATAHEGLLPILSGHTGRADDLQQENVQDKKAAQANAITHDGLQHVNSQQKDAAQIDEIAQTEKIQDVESEVLSQEEAWRLRVYRNLAQKTEGRICRAFQCRDISAMMYGTFFISSVIEAILALYKLRNVTRFRMRTSSKLQKRARLHRPLKRARKQLLWTIFIKKHLVRK